MPDPKDAARHYLPPEQPVGYMDPECLRRLNAPRGAAWQEKVTAIAAEVARGRMRLIRSVARVEGPATPLVDGPLQSVVELVMIEFAARLVWDGMPEMLSPQDAPRAQP